LLEALVLRHCQSLLFHRVSPHRLSIAPITLLKRSRLLVQRCLNMTACRLTRQVNSPESRFSIGFPSVAHTNKPY
jgi:hypothetical protein